MIDKKYYRKATSAADLGMLLEQGVEGTIMGKRLSYDIIKNNPFRCDGSDLNTYWKYFAMFEPIMTKPHWSAKASAENKIPCYVWDGVTRPSDPHMEYVISPYNGLCYWTDSGANYSSAEPIRTEDKR